MRKRHRSSIVLYTVDQRVAALAYLSLTLFQLGYPDQAIVRIEEALDEARKLGHPPSLAYALQHACVLHQNREDANSVMRHANALISLAAEQAFPYWSIAGQTSRGVALLELGQAEEGIAALEKGVGAMQLIGAEIGMPGWMAFLGMAYGQIGQSDKGLELVDRALALAAAREERWNYAELHRFEGELLAAARRPDRPAEACFCRAIAVARDQAARLWELRAAISLARLWCDQGRRAEAHDLLAPVYGWFTEGFDTADLKDAKALLDELA
jgi:predicted ATPase